MLININKLWAELDLNQRRHCQRIYSPSPLTTRASTQKKGKNNKVRLRNNFVIFFQLLYKKLYVIMNYYKLQRFFDNTPRGIRIPVASLKERCPRPLDDGGFNPHIYVT